MDQADITLWTKQI